MSRLGKMNEAEAELSALLEAEPENVAAIQARAGVYEELRDWLNAIGDASTVLELDATNAEARRLRGVAQFHLGRYQDAIDDLDSDAVRAIDTASLQWIRSRCFVELDQKFRAREELNTLIETDPAHEQARLMRASLAEQQGEFDVAIADMSVLLEQQPENVDLMIRRGLLQHREGLYEKAIEDFSKVLEIKPESAEALYRRGLARHQLQQDEDAISDLDEALKLDEKHADAWYVKGNINAGQGKASEALDCYQHAVDLEPAHAAAWYNRGNLLFNENEMEKAVESWTKALEFQPNLFRAYNNRAAAQAKLGKFEEAIADYERAVSLSPGFARAWDNYAWLLATNPDPSIRDTTRAVFMAKKAVELTGSKDWSCLSTLAAAYAEAGDMDQAATWAQKSQEVAPEEQRDEIEQLVKTYQSRRLTRRSTSTAVRNDASQKQ
jgi:tetratricopeptide (TPR) repeat protein